MEFPIVIASLLGVFLAPALANHNMEKNFNGQPSENSNHSDTRVSTNPKERSEAWKTIWDFKTGYVATKVFSKNTCIIATTSKRFWFGKRFPTPPQGDKGLGPYQLPPRENRFIISRNRLQSLSPYGKRIQALCRGIPSYLAYPAPGSNFLRGSNFLSGSNFLERDISRLKFMIN
ncbi:gastrokine-1-like [Corvus hawaiiensis]|uniref:gastrokine-1-like n=1 Tax=Corvus hawaiiensis TaxID=134902 RepID=UPI002019178E|nr:gastrokine-1-like [Corvus hawaiiensis]